MPLYPTTLKGILKAVEIKQKKPCYVCCNNQVEIDKNNPTRPIMCENCSLEGFRIRFSPPQVSILQRHRASGWRLDEGVTRYAINTGRPWYQSEIEWSEEENKKIKEKYGVK